MSYSLGWDRSETGYERTCFTIFDSNGRMVEINAENEIVNNPELKGHYKNRTFCFCSGFMLHILTYSHD